MQPFHSEPCLLPQQVYLCQRMIENGLIGVALVQDKKLQFVNTQFATILGYSVEYLLQSKPDLQQLFPRVPADFFNEKIQPHNEVEKKLETVAVHNNGQLIDVEVFFLPPEKNRQELIVYLLDIHQRKKNERTALLANLVYENTSEAIVVTDENGIVVDMNPAFTHITGYERADIVGRSMNLLSSGRQGRSFYKKMWRQLKSTGRWKGDIWNKRKSGEEYTERLTISTCYNEDGSVFRRIGLFFDITQDKVREELMWRQANHDHLTDLPNRQMFQARLQQAMQEADEHDKPFALIFLDLDLFKDVNDTFGHDKGDKLLKQAAKRLLSCVRDTDTVARIGGDEFTVIVVDVPNQEVVERICKDILIKIAQPYFLGESTANVSASIGVTFYPEDAEDAGELLKNADMAMYASKECGRNQYCFFLPAMSEAIQARMLFSQNLQTAVREDQFVLFYQPIVDMRTGQASRFEALIRWKHPELGLVPPSEYIPFAEDSGLIVDIGNWVFKAAVNQAKKWHEQNHHYVLSLNVSPAQFYADGVKVEDWVQIIKDAGLPCSAIVLEITERLLLEDNPIVTSSLNQLRQAGIHIALDDFGTGFSSLTYLKRYPIDAIKIDQSFVRHLAPDSEDLALCEAMIVMAQKLGLSIIAEGIEGPQQEQLLLEAGCVLGQGYLYSRPVSAEDLELWLNERKEKPNMSNNSSDRLMGGQLP